MDLNSTSHVILGMLGLGPMSGYEIKQFVDGSTRFFWAASYGQIYPELRRLAAAGLIEADAPEGGRRRTVFRLTEAGARALREWLAVPAEIQEMRDESLLKVFFSGFAGTEATAEALDRKREHHLEIAARLRAIETEAKQGVDPRDSTYTTLRFGIALNTFAAEWCAEAASAERAAQPGHGKAA
jgi:PadR family transcriptional regulator AphA